MPEEKLTKEEIENNKIVLEDLKKANLESKALLTQLAEAKAEALVSGKADAGREPPKKTHDEEVTEQAKELLKGTGLDPFAPGIE